MCGRFTLTVRDLPTLAELLGLTVDPALVPQYRPRFNVAPTQRHWIVTQPQRRQLGPARWGLGPKAQINARSETARTKPMFRRAFANERCVVPADGFYEWQGPPHARRPMWIHPRDGGLLLFAGLYEEKEEDGARFTILTCAANDELRPIHDRMPAVLVGSEVDRWLAPGAPTELERLLGTLPTGQLTATEVSLRVNKVEHDDPACLGPPEAPPPPRQLKLW
jgi:putative SOS response-associated peptidase YedK